jgi:class 3 adenylate cyclase
MAKHPSNKVVPLPLLKGSTIEDTLSGFAPQMDQNAYLGKRTERVVTVLASEIRGWEEAVEAQGSARGDELLQETVDRMIEVIESLGGGGIALGGSPTRPTLVAWFDDDNHALRAVVAAETARDAAAQGPHPCFHACIGLSTGVVVDTHVNGGGLEFQASGTLKMFAARLQEFAGPDQVFLSEATYHAIPTHLDVVPIGGVRTSGDGETQNAYCLRGLLPRSAAR